MAMSQQRPLSAAEVGSVFSHGGQNAGPGRAVRVGVLRKPFS